MSARPTDGASAPTKPARRGIRLKSDRPDFKAIAARALAVAESLCRHLLPDGKRQGAEWVATNPTRTDHTAGSFSVNVIEGVWSDFATGESGSDLIALWAYVQGCSQGEAAAALARWLGLDLDTPPPDGGQTQTRPTNTAPAVAPIPKDAPAPPAAHPELGRPSATWTYRDRQGAALFYVCRFEAEPRKQFRPLTFDGARWTWRAPAAPRPLYGLDRLAARPESSVILAEGEKAADAVEQLCPDHIAVASLNGAQSPGKADWSALRGRLVWIWPDADQPGAHYAEQAARLIEASGAASVSVLDLSSFGALPEGFDAADALAAGWTQTHIEQLFRETERGNPQNHRDSRDERDSHCFSSQFHRDAESVPPGRPGQRSEDMTLPDGWKLGEELVFEDKTKPDAEEADLVPVCGPLWVVGRTISAQGEYGLVLVFVDHDRQHRRLAIPASRLHEDATILARELARMGLRILPGRERALLKYLDAWTPRARIPSAKRLGWQDATDGKLTFVLPDRVITAAGASTDVVYQPERFAPTSNSVHAAGTLDGWRDEVAHIAARHSVMLVALASGFAPALLAFAEASDSFVVHFWGRTSRGKTTLAQIAASPWGCAADPNDAPSLTFIRRWNLTGNGLEGLAEAHSDLPLILDELGANTADVRPMVYSLAGGLGKTALDSSRALKEPRSWRTVCISTGEMSLEARMSEGGQPIKGGLVHRALDIEVEDIVAETPAPDREALVERVKIACARHYGTAGPEFVARLTQRFASTQAARAYVRATSAAILRDLVGKVDLPQETRRALKRFALIALAGEMAAEEGLIPVTSSAIRKAVKKAAEAWLGEHADTDDLRILAAVRTFIHRHAARFQVLADDSEPLSDDDRVDITRQAGRVVPDRVGWFNAKEREHWLLPHGLIEAAPGHDATTIARALNASGCLHTDKDGRLTRRVSVEGSRPRVYAITSVLLVEESIGEATV